MSPARRWGGEVVADLGEAGALGRVRPEHWAADAGVFVDARGGESAAAVADRQLAPFEVAEELFPFLVGGSAVFLGRPQRPAPGDERLVVSDDFLGIGGLVAHGDVDIAVPGDDLSDVRRTIESDTSPTGLTSYLGFSLSDFNRPKHASDRNSIEIGIDTYGSTLPSI